MASNVHNQKNKINKLAYLHIDWQILWYAAVAIIIQSDKDDDAIDVASGHKIQSTFTLPKIYIFMYRQ